MKETMKVGIGQTPQLCQDALIEMLRELFAGKKYNGQEGRKPLKSSSRTFQSRRRTMWTPTPTWRTRHISWYA